jgi:hypothetical protein
MDQHYDSKYKCIECEYTASNKKELFRHMRTHDQMDKEKVDLMQAEIRRLVENMGFA